MVRSIRFTVLVAVFLTLFLGGQWLWDRSRQWHKAEQDAAARHQIPDPSSPNDERLQGSSNKLQGTIVSNSNRSNVQDQAKQKQEHHKPHTRPALPSAEVIAKLPADGGKEFNRLIFEKSPYLLQHARNPVDWYPWGKEAFEKAKKEGKPIFLSIGYSTCHWCHVMEHESFESEEIAKLMNKHFVCIKLDREERPDIDNIYMTACQAMNGNGGWPLNAILTADRKPFFVTTYLPPTAKAGRIGMKEFVPRIAELWSERKEDIEADAERLTKALQQMNVSEVGDAIGEETLDKAFKQLESRFDEKTGGFSRAPKFPTPHTLTFLLRYYKRTGEKKALQMVEKTLTEMRNGGIYDQVGYGFHRYSTDSKWLLPHFEKMLYDQALLTFAYSEAYQVTKDPWYRQAALETIQYVRRDMTSKEGAFYSAEDADSEGIEGKFYLWSEAELEEALTEQEFQFFKDTFQIKKNGNFYSPHCPPKTNIPHLTGNAVKLAADAKMDLDKWEDDWQKIRVKLFDVRKKRIPPYKDDKVLTDWNGLMIAAMAKAGRVFEDPEVTGAAKKAADFLLEKLRDKDGKLLKRYRGGVAGLPAHLEDYAFTVWGLLELYESTFETKYLQAAVSLNQQMLDRFWDDKNGGLYFTADDGEKLLVRAKESYDGAIPSGNSVAMGNLAKLSRITGNTDLEQKAVEIGKYFSKQIEAAPAGHSQMLCSADFLLGPSVEVVLATSGEESKEDDSLKVFLRRLRKDYFPNKVVVLRPSDSSELQKLTKLIPFIENQGSVDKKVTAYVCKNQTCKQPTNDPAVMMDSVKEISK